MIKFIPGELRLLWTGFTSGPRYVPLVWFAIKLLGLRLGLILSLFVAFVFTWPVLFVMLTRAITEWLEEQDWVNEYAAFFGLISGFQFFDRAFGETRATASLKFRNAKRDKAIRKEFIEANK